MRAASRSIGLLLTCSLLSPPAFAAASDPEPTFTQVDAKQVETSGALTRQIHEHWTSTIEPGLTWTDDAQAENRVRVVVRWIDSDVMHYGFLLEASRRDGETQSFQGECVTCTEAELVAEITGSMGDVGEFLRALPEQPPPPPVAAEDEAATEPGGARVSEPADVEPSREDEPVDEDVAGEKSARKARPPRSGLTKAGLAVGAVGAVTAIAPLVTGVWRYRLKEKLHGQPVDGPDRKDKMQDRIDQLGPITLATGIAAGALLVCGTTLYLVGRGRDRRTALAPVLAPTFAGVSLSGRF
ncbi:MAG: hypothetical protein B7733_18955 [Myxococcales bacterium FL481]|nr:MAG: hypothetical protein B7733_18955 [Myxococcales bacterium FL481]